MMTDNTSNKRCAFNTLIGAAEVAAKISTYLHGRGKVQARRSQVEWLMRSRQALKLIFKKH